MTAQVGKPVQFVDSGGTVRGGQILVVHPDGSSDIAFQQQVDGSPQKVGTHMALNVNEGTGQTNTWNEVPA